MIRAGVGQSQIRNSREAGLAIAEAALESLGALEPRLVLLHATEAYDRQALIGAVRERLGATPLAGCTAEGVIGPAGSDEGSHAASLLLLGGCCEAAVHLEAGLASDPEACGKRLAAWVLGDPVSDPKVLLVFPDGLSGDCGAMIEALDRDLPPGILVTGGSAGDAMRMQQSFQFRDAEVHSDSVSVALIGGPIVPRLAVSHGCSAVGQPMEVTRSEGAMVHCLDGRPTWEVFQEFLEGDPAEAPIQEVFHLCLLQDIGEAGKGGAVARSPLGIDRESGAMHFPGGLREGARVRMGMRDPARVASTAIDAARRLFTQAKGGAPICVLQFDCAGRGRNLFGPKASEIATLPLQQILGSEVPWEGFHTFGEIAPVGAQTLFHNYTVVLCALYQDDDSVSEPVA